LALAVRGLETTGVAGDFFPPKDGTENLGAPFDFATGGFLLETTGVTGAFFPPKDGTENLGALEDAFLDAGGFATTAFLEPKDGNENLEATGDSFLVVETTFRVFVAPTCVLEKLTL